MSGSHDSDAGTGLGVDDAEEDYYALLNLPRTANKEEVKSQYMELAKVLHPDKRWLLHRAHQTENTHSNSDEKTGHESKIRSLETLSGDSRKVDGEAQDLFLRVDAAYKTLTDDRSRKIYDDYGMAGIKALEKLDQDGAEGGSGAGVVGRYDQLGENIRVKLLKRLRLEQDLADLDAFDVNGIVQANVDASSLPGLSMTELHIQQVVTVPVPWFWEAQLNGKGNDSMKLITSLIVARGEVGLGNLVVGHQHQLSDYTAVSTKFQTNMKSNRWSIQGNRTFSRRVDASMELLREGGRVGIQFKCTRALSDHTSGAFNFGLGSRSGAGLELVRTKNYRPPPSVRSRERMRRAFAEHLDSGGNRDDFAFDLPVVRKQEFIQHTVASIQLREGSGNLNFEWLNSVTSSTHAGLELMLGTDKIEAEVKTIRRFGPQSKGGVSVAVGLQGVSLKLFFTRKQFQYAMPITLSHTFSLSAALVAGLIPACANYLIRLVLQPYQEIRDLRDRLREGRMLNEARQTAQTQRRVIIGHAQKLRRDEEASKGLVVLVARYGHPNSIHTAFDWRDVANPSDAELQERMRSRSPSDWDPVEAKDKHADSNLNPADGEEESKSNSSSEEHIYQEHPPNVDVTNQVQFFVKNSKLQLNAASKSKLLGFYNPLLGRNMGEPVLFIRYKLASWVYEMTFQDTDPIELPDPRARLLGNTFTQSAVDWST